MNLTDYDANDFSIIVQEHIKRQILYSTIALLHFISWLSAIDWFYIALSSWVKKKAYKRAYTKISWWFLCELGLYIAYINTNVSYLKICLSIDPHSLHKGTGAFTQ